MLTWMDVLAAAAAVLVVLARIAVVAVVLLLLGCSARAVLRARRRPPPALCSCGRLVLPAGADHIDYSPVRHAAGLCQPLREVIGR
jgi:hypothetical protein